jgi:caffeoyl-CoA O-methyltransferase
MSFKTIPLSEELHAYVVAHGSAPDEIAADLLAETRALFPDLARMSIAPEQAAFLTLLTRIMGVRRAVEVGTFTGFSSLAIARGLAPDGRLVCCDISDEYTRVARRYWERAGVADRIELRLGPAADTLRDLDAAGLDAAGLDLAFVDADKTGYVGYWAELVPRMRPGGVIIADNVLSGGRVLDPGASADARAIVEFNEIVLADDRVDSMLLPIGDGLTFARKR